LGAQFPGFTTAVGSPVPLPFTPDNVAAITATPQGAAAFAAFQQAVIDGTTAAVTQGVTAAVLGSDLTNPAANPLLGFQALQLVPQTANLPNGFEDTRVVDDDISFTFRGAFDVTDNINVYASYSTGFKASSVNLSRNSGPLLSNFLDENGRPIAEGFAVLPENFTVRLEPTAAFPAGQLIDNDTLDSDIPADGVANIITARNFGSRFAAPEETTNIEIGLQSNVFIGSGFVLANAGEQSARGVEWDASWTPIEPLTLTFAGTYLDANFDEFLGQLLHLQDLRILIEHSS